MTQSDRNRSGRAGNTANKPLVETATHGRTKNETSAYKTNRRTVGTYYENVAAEYLISDGYSVLKQNFRCHMGEIDIIARKDGVLVFVEVKYRRNIHSGSPEASVTPAKQKIICRVALFYLQKFVRSVDIPMSFDVIAINSTGRVHHIKNAFGFSLQ